MLKRPARVATIHDLSGFGRCSLSVIMPLLSVMGVQCVPIPTAVLSTHTGGFSDIEIRDLSDYLTPTLAQYQKEKIEFECIYTGFLASEEQIDYCLKYKEEYKNSMMFVDPVMGDHGKQYKTYTKNMCNRMKELVKIADVITPNPTEVSLLLGEEYNPTPLTVQECKTKLLKLSDIGPATVVITGVPMADMTVNNVGYDRENNSFWRVKCRYVPATYPGTGDIFASIMVASALKGDSLPIAMERATRFIELAVKTTFSYGTDPRYGVLLETALPWLCKDQVLDMYEIM